MILCKLGCQVKSRRIIISPTKLQINVKGDIIRNLRRRKKEISYNNIWTLGRRYSFTSIKFK